MRAFLHTYGPGDTRETTEVPVKTTERPRAGRTVSGYGSRIPTQHMIRHAGRWRRVYAACFANAPSFYIGKPGAWVGTVDVESN